MQCTAIPHHGNQHFKHWADKPSTKLHRQQLIEVMYVQVGAGTVQHIPGQVQEEQHEQDHQEAGGLCGGC